MLLPQALAITKGFKTGLFQLLQALGLFCLSNPLLFFQDLRPCTGCARTPRIAFMVLIQPGRGFIWDRGARVVPAFPVFYPLFVPEHGTLIFFENTSTILVRHADGARGSLCVCAGVLLVRIHLSVSVRVTKVWLVRRPPRVLPLALSRGNGVPIQCLPLPRVLLLLILHPLAVVALRHLLELLVATGLLLIVVLLLLLLLLSPLPFFVFLLLRQLCQPLPLFAFSIPQNGFAVLLLFVQLIFIQTI